MLARVINPLLPEEDRICAGCPVRDGLDPLTGARDRAALMKALQLRLGGLDGVTLLLLDLDGFKQVNDATGHPAGDRLLRSVANRVRRALRRDDVLVRLGGGEFTALLPAITDGEAADVGARIVNLLGRPFMLDGQVAHIGASIGCARHPRDASALSELLRVAQLALHSAKEAGRGRMTFASLCLREDAEEQIQLEADLPTALALDQFCLLCQPRYDLASGGLTGFEALSQAGISLAEVAAGGQAAIQSTLLLLQQAVDGQHRRSRLLGEMPAAKPALVT